MTKSGWNNEIPVIFWLLPVGFVGGGCLGRLNRKGGGNQQQNSGVQETWFSCWFRVVSEIVKANRQAWGACVPDGYRPGFRELQIKQFSRAQRHQPCPFPYLPRARLKPWVIHREGGEADVFRLGTLRSSLEFFTFLLSSHILWCCCASHNMLIVTTVYPRLLCSLPLTLIFNKWPRRLTTQGKSPLHNLAF